MLTIKAICRNFLIFSISSSTSSHADVVVSHKTDNSINLSIEGEIRPSDYALLIGKSNKSKHLIVRLNSAGGNLETATKIGRYLRKKNASAFVYNGATCASACVFVLMGAPVRFVESNAKILIHRFYEPNDTEVNSAIQKQKYKK